MPKKFSVFFIFFVFAIKTYSQEIRANLTVLANKVSSQVDKKIFLTLQTGIANFINNRHWTTDAFKPSEKIQCNFLLNIEQDLGNNVFKGKLTVQAARPVYNTSYDSPIMNFLDDNIVFRYQEFQPIEFNENRVQGNDPVAANLPAILAYYVNLILGFDYDSYALRGGDVYFNKAMNIVNNAPEGRDISGWKSFESQRNRYWLAENINDNRFALMHDALYAYYRSGMDLFFENENEARNGIMKCLNFLNTLDSENPNSMIMPFFFQGKSSEILKVFSRATADQKSLAKNILSKLDVTNASAYKELK